MITRQSRLPAQGNPGGQLACIGGVLLATVRMQLGGIRTFCEF